ncbi:alpha/beta fold hydrolase [Palleronia rufa]|uniref:alpha/beta fold hydrolase n=1 Tax=Palleronia rufa TaxID=1530186 RepID=UPI000563C3EB|nr:alpha/beta fold hydrolase [Palleronia rufa]
MSELLLIHGSCHGAWCWDETLAALGAMGQPARAIDLPGHGADQTPRDRVTLDGYADAILAAIDAPVTLVGHSMGGFPITAAALRAPEKIARLVYLCAYIPQPGKSLADMRHLWPEQPLLPAIVPDADRVAFSFAPDRQLDLFYHDCPSGTLEHARAHLTPQPLAPQRTPLDPATPRVERHAILCEDDRAVPVGFQALMAEGIPAGNIQRMPTSHSPFFAAPEDLARRLAAIAAT